MGGRLRSTCLCLCDTVWCVFVCLRPCVCACVCTVCVSIAMHVFEVFSSTGWQSVEIQHHGQLLSLQCGGGSAFLFIVLSVQ